jgi:LAS superfamily LD-carboxypeptidase LdcB
LNVEQLTGRTRTHIVELAAQGCSLHRWVVTPFLALRAAAGLEGMDLVAVSSFRDFARQLAIWNAKFSGERTVLDAQGRPLDALALSETERVDAILLWSALPGASRHHWGTDIDLIDRAAVPAGYTVQLTGAEFAAGGPFAQTGEWLDSHAPRYGFFRPYQGLRSGVRPEPWHYSFAPIAEEARDALNLKVFKEAIESASLQGKSVVLERLEELHRRYIASVDSL